MQVRYLKRKLQLSDRIKNATEDDFVKSYKALIVTDEPTELKKYLNDSFEVTSTALSYIENSESIVNSFLSINGNFFDFNCHRGFFIRTFYYRYNIRRTKKDFSSVYNFSS